jgi:hypothetical protein
MFVPSLGMTALARGTRQRTRGKWLTPFGDTPSVWNATRNPLGIDELPPKAARLTQGLRSP